MLEFVRVGEINGDQAALQKLNCMRLICESVASKNFLIVLAELYWIYLQMTYPLLAILFRSFLVNVLVFVSNILIHYAK